MPNKSEEMQQFLDQNQYSSNSILRYEKIFGRGFVSSGGLETTKVGDGNGIVLFYISKTVKQDSLNLVK